MDLNPQQTAFLSYYTNPQSDTFGNAYQSAIKANYTEEYAKNITGQMPDWLSENIRDIKMLDKAEKNLDKALDISIDDDKHGDKALKVTIFVAERLGKKKYSVRNEVTGAEGKDLTINIVKYADNSTSQV